MSDFFDLGPLVGERVRLEPLGPGHVAGLVEAARDGRDRFTLTGVPDGEVEARQYVDEAAAGRSATEMIPFATVDLRTGLVVGSTRFLNFEYWRWRDERFRRRPAGEPDAVEIGGTWLARDAQRTGINREAKRLMLTVAFDRWRLARVSIRTDARNERSRAAIAGLGAHLDGIVRAARAGFDGEIRDDAVFSILDTEWPAVRAALSAPRP